MLFIDSAVLSYNLHVPCFACVLFKTTQLISNKVINVDS
jgi:hypothetical protein